MDELCYFFSYSDAASDGIIEVPISQISFLGRLNIIGSPLKVTFSYNNEVYSAMLYRGSCGLYF